MQSSLSHEILEKYRKIKMKLIEKLNQIKQRRRDKLNEPTTMKDVVKAIVLTCVVFLIFTFILFLGTASSGSMESTIKTGDVCVANRLAYISDEPERGDIIYFRRDNTTYGKRVVGIAGDSIEFVDGYVYINGERYVEDYIPESVETNSNRTFEVPAEHVFVMGDNREDSLDSRHWDEPYISEDDIVAKYLFVIPTHVILDFVNSLAYNEIQENSESIETQVRELGDSGVVHAITNDGKQIETTYMSLDKVYVGEDAKDIIQKYCNSEKCPYEYEEAPAGYSWHVIEYTTDTAPEDLYIDIRLRGLDGEKLKFRGVAASERTHDIYAYVSKTDAGYEKQYCYYAVPDEYEEYILTFGVEIKAVLGVARYQISVD